MWSCWLLGVLAVAARVVLAGAAGNRLLVVVESDARPSYARFLESLDSRGYEVTLRDPASVKKDNALYDYGERAFDHIALLVPELKGLKGALAPQALVRFAEDGGNLFVALSPSLSEAWRDLAREFSLEFAERGTSLVDHFGYDREHDTGDHTAVLVGGHRAHFSAGGAANPVVFSDATRAALATQPLTYRGIAHWIGPNPLAFPLLVPPSTAYESEVPKVSGKGSDAVLTNLAQLEQPSDAAQLLVGFEATAPDATAALASAVQLRTNSARVVFVGSTELLQNAALDDAARSVHRAVVDDLTAWTFQERGVLRVVRSTHERCRASEADTRPDYEEEVGVATKMYRIKDRVYFTMDVQQYRDGRWTAAPTDLDLQLAITMLDPYVTLPLEASVVGDVTRYSGVFRLPDRHGVFTFRVNWKRHGWTYILTEDVAPVRPFNHDEYPRMLSSSWPYVAGAISTMVGFVAFCVQWIYMSTSKVPQKVE